MEREPVSSINLASVGYDSSQQLLEIELLNSSVYEYFSVPDTVHAELMNASSHGNYFHANIKSVFQFGKIG